MKMIRKVTMTALILVVLIIWTILGKVVSGALGKWEQRAVQALKKKILHLELQPNKRHHVARPIWCPQPIGVTHMTPIMTNQVKQIQGNDARRQQE